MRQQGSESRERTGTAHLEMGRRQSIEELTGGRIKKEQPGEGMGRMKGGESAAGGKMGSESKWSGQGKMGSSQSKWSGQGKMGSPGSSSRR